MALNEILKAVSQGDVAKTLGLLGNGRLINEEQGNKALVAAAEYGQAALIEALVAAGADINGSAFRNSMTPLMRAAQRGNTETVTLLLDRGADINGRGVGGLTALMLAASKGERATLEVLLTRGADTRLRDYEGHTALALAEEELARMQNYATPDEKSNAKLQAETKQIYKDVIAALSVAGQTNAEK